MTKVKSYGKKALSIFIAILMCLTVIPLVDHTLPVADAATAGTYDIKVELTITNGADGWDKNVHTLYHTSNNGKGTPSSQSVSLTTANMDEAKTHTFTYTGKGFPTSYKFEYSFGGGFTWRELGFTLKVYASKSGANSYKEVISASFSDSSSAFNAASGTWTQNASSNIPTPTSISWTNTAKTITVPKSGTATATTSSATVYDQYGVQWYQEPYYALNSSSTATSTTETISGITRTTAMSDTCTVSVTNAAKTWVDNGGSSYRDVYVTAYLSSAKSTTTKFTINQVQYNVKFYNGDTLLNTTTAAQSFYYNKQPSYNGVVAKEEDAQYTYVFDGWTTAADGSGTVYSASTLPVATADTVYYAHYNNITKQYKVTFENYDGTVLQSGSIYYGTLPVYEGETPVKENTPEYSYEFIGWSPEVSEVTGTVTYTAQFSETKNKYAVEFRDDDGNTLDVQTLEYGTLPVYEGETPTKASTEQYSYVFTGWSPEIVEVTTQALYIAQFDPVLNSYKIIFKNDDGTIIQETDVSYGDTPSCSVTPTKASDAEYDYTFSGWSPAIETVTGEKEYIAVYDKTKRSYNVYYKNYDGTSLTEEEVVYGEAAQMAQSLSPERPASDGKTYVFAGWSADLTSIKKNTYAVAQYAVEGVENYWVTFVDGDGNVLYKTVVEEGGTAVYGGDELNKDGYEFVGWDKELSNITEDTTVTALYSKEGEQYVVTYVDWDDTFITSMIVKHGENAVTPADPERAGDENTVYTFSGWDNDGISVTENLVIKATYETHIHEYNTFVETVVPGTCISNRTDTMSCSCGLTQNVEISDSLDENEHVGTLTLSGVLTVTCTENGYTGDMVCDACNNVAEYGDVITAEGHKPGEATAENVESGSCTVPGSYEEVYYCTVCGDELSREPKTGALLPHTEDDPVIENEVAPDCTNDGSYDEVIYCSVCGEELSRLPVNDPALGHDMGEFVETSAATCTAKGEETSDCSRCDYYETRELEMIAHTEEEIPAVDATCTESGLTAGVKCSECDEVLTAQTETPALGHDMGEFVETSAATCTAKGEETSECSRCDYFETRELETIAHTEEEIPAVDATCTESGLTAGVKCSECDEILTEQTETPALGHDMGEFVETSAATCTAKGEETSECSRCDYYETRELEMIAHAEEEIPAVDATCTESGLTAGVKCSECDEILTEQTETPALGHDMGEFVETSAATCTVKGEETSECSRCDYFETRELETIAHTEEEIPAVDATCTESGLTAGVKCSECDEVLTAQTETPALGHDMGEFVETSAATCTAKGEETSECSRCDYFETREIETIAHTEEEIPAVDATCTESGLTAGVKCSECDEVLTAQTETPALGHDMGEFVETSAATCTVKGEETSECSRCDYFETRELETIAHTEEEIPAVDATCTESGLTVGVKCSECDEVLTAQTETPALGHDMGEFVETTAATCTAKGEERADCSRCDYFETREIAAKGHSWTDADCTAPSSCGVCGETSGSAIGHDMGEFVVTTAATCTAKGEETSECSRCDYFETREIEMIAHTEEEIPAVDATCTESGLTAGVKCSECDEILTEQTETPALGHDMGEFVETTAATCTAKGEETSECSRCDYYETRELEMIAHTEEEIPAVDATCTESGLTAGVKCSECDEVLTAQTETPALGHDMGEFVETSAATCTAKGEETSECSRCDYFETREIEMIAHTEEEIPAVDATCTESGLTAGVKCSECDEVLTAQTETPALGHDMGEFVETTAATCTAKGEETSDCSRCDYYETREIETIAHTEEEIPAVDATCTESGLTAGVKCSECDEVLTAQTETPALGHDMGEYTVVTSSTCSAVGIERADCSRCDHFVTRELEKLAHTEENVVGKAPTCTESGLTDGIKCSVCGAVIKAQTVIGANGHNLGEWTVSVQPTCTENGSEQASCSECSYVAIRTVNAVGHNFEDGVCTDCGIEGSDCMHICHRQYNIFAKIVWSIILFICRIFGLAETCSCGDAHY